MSPIVLLSDERTRAGERLCVRWVTTEQQFHQLEIAIEKKRGDTWERGYFLTLTPGEVFRLHDAVGAACFLAMRVDK